MPNVTILLALYNGAPFLREQLESIARQNHQNWTLLISDDASHDASLSIAKEFAATQPAHKVRILRGPCLGSASNFLSMIPHVPAGSYLAYCDQDDVWLPEKLDRALDQLRADPGVALYAARTTFCAEDLTPLGASRVFHRPYSFRNALIQASAAGNTCVISPQGVGLLQQAVSFAIKAGISSHDWWSYQLISGAGGRVIRDNHQVLLYRQHGNNLMGRNDTRAALTHRFKKLTDGHFGRWLDQNNRALAPALALLRPENQTIFKGFMAALQKSGPAMAVDFAKLGLYRQSRIGSTALYAAAFTGRLR